MDSTAGIDVSILIVSYNTKALTLACLDSLAGEVRGTACQVIVVDNASSDGSAAAIAAHPLKPRLIGLDHNIGFAAGNNAAAEHARGAYILLLNPDTVVLEGAIARLVAFARAKPGAGVWGGRTLFGDGRLNPASCWGRMTPWNLFCRASGLTGVFPRSETFNAEAFGGWQRDTVRQVDIVSGCFLLITRDLWTRLGGFDPLFFMYGEEADLCLRAAALGARPLVTPAATILHYGGASERARADKMVRLLSAKASLIDRHWSAALRPLGLALNAAWPLTRHVAWRVTGLLHPSVAACAAASTWGEIWRRRSEWWRGYRAAAGTPTQGRVQMAASTTG